MLLASEFGNQGQWTNIECDVKQPYMCFRDGADYGPPLSPEPKAEAHCPPIQYFTGSGIDTQIYSPNYLLSIPNNQTCEYVMATSEGTMASIKFAAFDCQTGTYLSLFDGFNSNQPFVTFTSNLPAQSFAATSNVMKIVFIANGTSAPVGTGWEAELTGI